jgi:hypothetical protein
VPALADRFDPVLDLKALHSAEFSGVVGHEGESGVAGVGGDEQIVCADQVSTNSKSGASAPPVSMGGIFPVRVH